MINKRMTLSPYKFADICQTPSVSTIRKKLLLVLSQACKVCHSLYTSS
ncbi:hypothetical protein F892_01413 [Acinetobacter vivianii]|uniref:Uncharacterized protein n=1 Tax=Acinetobacter vivianii TaxID=1776742 RepID=N9Q5A5_9GAMM|nr:hypothetical protein F892_01413 [Acinetobacter vivianii]